MIFGVGTNSTNRLPLRVEIFLDGANGFSFPTASRVNIWPKVKSLTAAAWKIASIFLPENDFSFARKSAVVEKTLTARALRSPV